MNEHCTPFSYNSLKYRKSVVHREMSIVLISIVQREWNSDLVPLILYQPTKASEKTRSVVDL